jgi:predicted alpha/beta-hydrolase family hydrolase
MSVTTINKTLKITLKGNLFLPKHSVGLVLFSHGSGSSRLSPRNNYVAEVLQKNGLATLLFDLLTKDEDRIYETRFNIDLLTKRLIEVT